MNKNKKKVLLIITLLTLSIIVIFIYNKSINRSHSIVHITDAQEFKTEYETLNNKELDGNKLLNITININNKIKYANVSEIEYFINSRKSMVLYIGTADCPYCRSIAKTLTDMTIDSNLETIYYLKNDPTMNDYDKILTLLGDKFTEELDGTKRLKSGVVIFIVDGDIIAYQFDTVYSHDNPYIPMDEWQEKGLKSIYENGIYYVTEATRIQKERENSNT